MEARKYAVRQRQHLSGTGGGPPLVEPDVPTKAMYDVVHGSTGEGMIGIQSGVETGCTKTIGQEENNTEDDHGDDEEVDDEHFSTTNMSRSSVVFTSATTPVS